MRTYWPLLTLTLVGLAWAAAFVVGRSHDALYPVLATAAVVLSALSLWSVRGLSWPSTGSAPSTPIVGDLLVGLVVGVATLGATYGLYPILRGLWPPLQAEVQGLYVLAAVSPRALVAVFVVVTAEECIWRRAWPRAMASLMTLSMSAPESFPSGGSSSPKGESQNRRNLATGTATVLVPSVAYALSQLGSGSLLLAAAALGLGSVWAALAWWRGGRLLAPLVAHMLWTPTVLGLWPLEAI